MIIYKTTNLLNGKFYIGKDEKNNPKYLGSGLLLKKAIKKYGKENFIKEILEFCDSIEILFEREKYWIKETQAQTLGYNIASGGRGGKTYTKETSQRVSEKIKKTKEERKKQDPNIYKMSDEQKAIISKTHKGKSHTEEWKKQHSEKMKLIKQYSEKWLYNQTRDKHGENGPFWNKKHTDETRQKMSEIRKANPVCYWSGKKQSVESNEKRRQASLKFRHTEEHKARIRGEGNPFYGQHHSEETKKKISESRKSKTPEQKLEKYIKFHISRTGREPTEEQKQLKYQEYSKNDCLQQQNNN